MNPGSPTPQAGILNQTSPTTPRIAHRLNQVAIRRPLIVPEYQDQIQKVLDNLTRNGKAPNTIRNVRQRLNQLSRLADLNNPEEIKLALGKAPLNNSSKQSHVFAYDCYCKTHQIQWTKPKYEYEAPTPIIPTTENVNKIISATTKRFATIFTIMKETGIEGEELHQMKRKNIDLEQGMISLSGTKGHASGSYKLKHETVLMLQDYLARNPEEQPFPTPKTMRSMWITARNKVAENLKQPQLKNIPLKSLRNYSGAQIYFKFGFMETVKHLRHKKADTTLHYIRAIPRDDDPEYDTQTAKTTQEAIELSNKGYTKFDEIDGIHIYRKRK